MKSNGLHRLASPHADPRLKPEPSDILRAGDRLVVVGDTGNLSRLAILATG